MNNRLASELVSKIPTDVKAAVPADKLASILNNPRALVNPDAQAQLKVTLSHLGSGGINLYNQIGGLRDGLAISIAEVFLMALYSNPGFYSQLIPQRNTTAQTCCIQFYSA